MKRASQPKRGDSFIPFQLQITTIREQIWARSWSTRNEWRLFAGKFNKSGPDFALRSHYVCPVCFIKALLIYLRETAVIKRTDGSECNLEDKASPELTGPKTLGCVRGY